MRWIGYLLLAVVGFAGNLVLGATLSVGPGNTRLLEGNWKGKVTARSGASVTWQRKVALTIEKGIWLEGDFSFRGRSSKTDVDLRKGKVLMEFDGDTRYFTLEREGAHTYLKTNCYSPWHEEITVVLKFIKQDPLGQPY